MVSTPKSYMREHDPYRGMEGPEIRPEFARQQLSEAEQSAVNGSNSAEAIKSNSSSKNRDPFLDRTKNIVSSTQNLRNIEENQRSQSFQNSVVGKNDKSQKKKKGIIKKGGPLAVIIGALFGGSLLFYAAQSILAPHLSSLYTEATDVQYTTYSLRNQRLFSYMLDGGNQIKISNFTTKYTTFSPYLRSRLQSNGIEVGYLDADGVFQTDQLFANSSTVLKYNDEIITASSFQDVYASNANFREAYYNAKRGRIAGFFDDVSEKFYQDRGATRDIFDQYKSTGDAETDTENFEQIVSDRVTGTDSTINTAHIDTDEETQTETVTENGNDLTTKSIDGSTPEAKARTFVNSLASKVSTVGVPVCSALRIANLAAIAVSAYQIYQSAAYFLSLMEPISKMMAGEGDSAAINEALNFLTTSTTTDTSYVDSNGNSTTTTITGSPLESTGAKLVLGNTASSQTETDPYSLDSITKAATTIAISTGVTTTVCSGVMAASALVSLTAAAVPGGSLAKIAIGMLAQTVGGVVITGIVAAVVSSIIPYISKMFFSNIFESYTGVPAGEIFSEGAASSNFALATQGSAYMPSSEETVKTQNRNTTVALAQEAEIDRQNRSPFDITSDNTFLGSLVSNFTYLAYTNNVTSLISNFNTTIGNSISKLTPASSAYDDELSYTSNYQECQNLSGAVCDMYGYPIVASDYSTIDISPDDSNYQSVISRNLDDNGNIKDDSELAKFINFCVNRESPWGVKDANILNALNSDAGIVVNNIPYVSDVIDLVNAAEDIENDGWATGETCLNSSDNPRWDNELKYYQLYVQDMRYLSGMEGYTSGSTSTTLTSGGLSLSEAEALMAEYKSLPSPQVSDPWDISGNDFPGSCGASLANCVEFSLYFINRYTSAHFSGLPDGHQVVGTLLNSNQGFTDGGHTPKAYAIFSYNSGSYGGAGHTGVVLGIDTANNKIILGEAGCGSGLDFIGAHEYSLSDWTDNPNITYAYTDNIIVSNGNISNIKTTNPVLAYEYKYEEENPKDTSFKGTMARITGMTTDDISFLMEMAEYSNELANYDPSTRYGYEQQPKYDIVSITNKITSQSKNQLSYNVIYYRTNNIFIDKRNYLV